ncbi:MAG: hypothetical protein ACLP7O_02230 [Terracidiphilus sp.]
MTQTTAQDRIGMSRGVDAVRATAAAFGVYAGILGMEHGYFETLQGNAAPKGLKILAVSPWELPFPFGHEPAMTLIPNFLVTGIAAMIAGLAIVLWSVWLPQKRYSAAVLVLLSVILLLVGGGFGPISLLIVACIAAANIDRRPTERRTHLPAGVNSALATLWPWSFAAALLWVPGEFVMGQVLHLKNDHRQILTNLNLLLSYPMLGLFVLTLIAGFAHEARRRSN